MVITEIIDHGVKQRLFGNIDEQTANMFIEAAKTVDTVMNSGSFRNWTQLLTRDERQMLCVYIVLEELKKRRWEDGYEEQEPTQGEYTL